MSGPGVPKDFHMKKAHISDHNVTSQNTRTQRPAASAYFIETAQ